MYRELGDIETTIFKMIIHMGARDGAQKVSSKKLAKACNISSGTIFARFGTMRNALDQAAQYFDRTYMNKLVELVNNNSSIYEIWDYFIDCLMEYPDGAMYYSSYTTAFGFDPTVKNERAAEFLEIAKTFFPSEKAISDDMYLLLWDYITSMAFYYAEKFFHYIPYTEENKSMVRDIVFKGVENIL